MQQSVKTAPPGVSMDRHTTHNGEKVKTVSCITVTPGVIIIYKMLISRAVLTYARCIQIVKRWESHNWKLSVMRQNSSHPIGIFVWPLGIIIYGYSHCWTIFSKIKRNIMHCCISLLVGTGLLLTTTAVQWVNNRGRRLKESKTEKCILCC